MSLIMRILERIHDQLHQSMNAEVTWLSFDEWATSTSNSGEAE